MVVTGNYSRDEEYEIHLPSSIDPLGVLGLKKAEPVILVEDNFVPFVMPEIVPERSQGLVSECHFGCLRQTSDSEVVL